MVMLTHFNLIIMGGIIPMLFTALILSKMNKNVIVSHKIFAMQTKSIAMQFIIGIVLAAIVCILY